MKYLLILFLLIPLISFSQTRQVNVDKFTGDSTIIINSEPLYQTKTPDGRAVASSALNFYIAKIKSATLLYLSVPSYSVQSIDNKKRIYIKLNNGEVIKLLNESGYKISTGRDFIVVYSTLSNESISKLKSFGVTDIRVETSKQNQDYEIKEDRRELIGKALNAL